MKVMVRSLAALVICASVPTAAFAAKRVALVVGVDDYDNVPKLEKATGDATAMGAELRRLGFDVSESLNPDRATLVRALAELRNRSQDADTVFLQFSGHGVAIDGENYLLPKDVSKPGLDKQLIEDESISQSELIGKLAPNKGQNRSLIVVLDACRDNPYAHSTRSVGGERGLARVEPPRGVFIMYSAGFGETALDRLSTNDKETTSVYTRVLLTQLAKPGSTLIDIANDTRAGVEALADSVDHDQNPAAYDELDGRKVILLPQPSTATTPTTTATVDVAPIIRQQASPAPEATTTVTPLTEAGQIWVTIQNSNDVETLSAFKAHYEGTFYATLADIRIKQISQTSKSLASAQPVPNSTKTIAKAPASNGPSSLFDSQKGCQQLDNDTVAAALTDPAGAQAVCEQALKAHPQDLHLAYLLGRAFEAQKNYGEASIRYRKAAIEGGDKDAMYQLGNLYHNGLGVAHDEKEASYWWHKAGF